MNNLDDEYKKLIMREKEKQIIEIRERQKFDIFLALKEHHITVDEVSPTDGILYDFHHGGMQVYIQNYITRLYGKIHRLPQSDTEEKIILEYRPLILLQGERMQVPKKFRKKFYYQQFKFSGKPKLAVAEVLNAVVLTNAYLRL